VFIGATELSSIATINKYCNVVFDAVRSGHAATKEKSDGIKDDFYEEIERVFDQFPV
jgi:hypothetical protein